MPDAGLMGVQAGEQRCASGAAARAVVKLGERMPRRAMLSRLGVSISPP
jgi:hypothetical protein